VTSTGTATRRHGDAAKNRESGYALLLIFAMAAAIAVMLYVELPRVAFEKQRDREQTLIERGEQYKRAIQLYFRKFKNYPVSIQALENTNNVRFLRHRYADPLTGKDEWRLIHVGPGGVFTDSITNKLKKDDKAAANQNTFITEGAAIGSALPENQRGAAGPPRRPSEGGQPQPGIDPSASGGVPGQMPGDPTQQGLVPGQPGVPSSGPVSPGAPPGTYGPPDGSTQPGTTPGAYPPTSPGSTYASPGQTPGNSSFIPPSQSGIVPPPGVGGPVVDPTQPTSPGAYTPGANPNQQGMSPADLIGNLLRQPRPTPGATAGMAGIAGGGQAITGGIAGVASKVEKPSIKIYNEREKYNEWEFIYDFSKDRTGGGRAAGMMGNGDPRLAQQGMQGIAAPGVGQPSTFGMQPGAGGPAGFGAQPGAAGGFGSNSGASGSSGGSGGGGIGSGFGGSVGSGFGSQPTPTSPAQPQQPVTNPPKQPVPQPGPIPPPPPPPPQGQTANPPQ
jgi:hypothetical protein